MYEKKPKLKPKHAADQLLRLNFKKVVDIFANPDKPWDLYYKPLGDNRYLIFNHFSPSRAEALQGFDCFIKTYKDVEHIGQKSSELYSPVRLCYNFDMDWKKVEDRFQKQEPYRGRYMVKTTFLNKPKNKLIESIANKFMPLDNQEFEKPEDCLSLIDSTILQANQSVTRKRAIPEATVCDERHTTIFQDPHLHVYVGRSEELEIILYPNAL